MKTIIQVSNTEHTKAIEDYITKKLKSLERFIDPKDTSATARVEVGVASKKHKKGEKYFAEVTLHTAGRDYRAVERADDLYVAIDAMKDEVVAEVKSFREKKRDVAKRDARTEKKKVKKV